MERVGVPTETLLKVLLVMGIIIGAVILAGFIGIGPLAWLKPVPVPAPTYALDIPATGFVSQKYAITLKAVDAAAVIFYDPETLKIVAQDSATDSAGGFDTTPYNVHGGSQYLLIISKSGFYEYRDLITIPLATSPDQDTYSLGGFEAAKVSTNFELRAVDEANLLNLTDATYNTTTYGKIIDPLSLRIANLDNETVIGNPQPTDYLENETDFVYAVVEIEGTGFKDVVLSGLPADVQTVTTTSKIYHFIKLDPEDLVRQVKDGEVLKKGSLEWGITVDMTDVTTFDGTLKVKLHLIDNQDASVFADTLKWDVDKQIDSTVTVTMED